MHMPQLLLFAHCERCVAQVELPRDVLGVMDTQLFWFPFSPAAALHIS